MKKILVTGGCGYIGSHTCLSLIEKGYKIVVIDSNINSSPTALKKIEKILSNKPNTQKIDFEKGDIRDENFLKNVFSKAIKEGQPIKAVIHFAGLKAVGESVKNPLLYWDVNLNGSLSLFRVMESFNCKTIVFSSSATIYGKVEKNPINESSPIRPYNPYGQTKASIEFMLNGLFKSCESRWRIANLRYFNPIGAHESGLLGENPSNKPNNLFPIVCKVAYGIYEKLHVYGNDWPTFDGTGIRDYIHVMDLADSHISALEYLYNNDPQILDLNIGTGIGTSVLELINTFQEVNKCKIPYRICDRRIGDVSTLVADNSRAVNLLNWKPTRTLKDMCLDGWNWIIRNPDGYKDKCKKL